MSLQDAIERSPAVKWVFGILASLIAAGVIGMWSLSAQVAALAATVETYSQSVNVQLASHDERIRHLERGRR